jgi:NADH dehydrogenase FAD-containing subunit
MKRPRAASRFPLVVSAAFVALTRPAECRTLAFAPCSINNHHNKHRRRIIPKKSADHTSSDHTSSSMLRQEQQEQHQQQQQQHLVLIGGGHAHVQVIKALNSRDRPLHLKVTLIDAQASASYSGMVPGCIAQHYTPDDTRLHLPPLAAWAGMDFVHDAVVDIDFDRKLVYTRHGQQEQPISFDVISMDIGSTSRDWHVIPGVRQYTIPTRPIDKLIARLERARVEWQEEQKKAEAQDEEKKQDDPAERPRIVVVGGGVAGVELAMVVESRWHDLQPHITLLDGGQELMPNESPVARNKLKDVLDSKKIIVHHGCTVTRVKEEYIELEEQTRTSSSSRKKIIPYTHCIWATGAGAHPLVTQRLHPVRGLATTRRGWIQVHDTLQSFSHPFVFAAGDCAEIQGLSHGPPAKAGVYAVRAGPILVENLTRYLQYQHGQQQRQQQQQPNFNISHDKDDAPVNKPEQELELIRYKPQDDFLKLIVCGNDTALGFRFGLVFYGKWVFQMKDQIDQSFMNLFRVEHLPQLLPETTSTTTTADAAAAAAAEKKKYDKQQYDARMPKLYHSRLNPQEAAELLQRTDDDVDFQMPWAVIREMAGDAAYRDRVLQHVAAAASGGGRPTIRSDAIRHEESAATNVNNAAAAAGAVVVGVLQ